VNFEPCLLFRIESRNPKEQENSTENNVITKIVFSFISVAGLAKAFSTNGTDKELFRE